MMIKRIRAELVEHFPFTIVGAVTGIVIMFIFKQIPRDTAHTVFYILHPIHVLLSALATSSLYSIYHCKGIENCRPPLWILLIVGYVGAIGIATVSDSFIPYLGEVLLDMPHRHAHIGFIEKWWLINPLAVVGIMLAYFRPAHKFPHAGHVLISTWASLSHIMMARGEVVTVLAYGAIFIFLILSVWIPCCVSDIVFPLLFVKEKKSVPEDTHQV